MEQVLRAHAVATEDIAEVARLAGEGDMFSIYTLYWIASESVSALNQLASEKPELFRSLARNTFSWPGTISRKRALKRANEELMDRLQLGQGVTFSTRDWRVSAASTRVAFALWIGYLLKHGPPEQRLTRKAKRELFEKIWAEEIAEGWRPEDNEKTAKLGKFAVGKKSTSRGMSEQTPGMRRDDVRAEIKRRVWEAFDVLVPDTEQQVKSLTTGNASS